MPDSVLLLLLVTLTIFFHGMVLASSFTDSFFTLKNGEGFQLLKCFRKGG